MIVLTSTDSKDIIPYDIRWRRGLIWKSRREWTFAKANAFANRMISRGFQVQINRCIVDYGEVKRYIDNLD